MFAPNQSYGRTGVRTAVASTAYNGQTSKDRRFERSALDIQAAKELPFQPINVIVSKHDHMLRVMSGSYVLATKRVGLGREDRTPEGTFTVQQRVIHPRGSRAGAYGAAGLGMGRYAVHGTFDAASIGANQSLGCIRLSDSDMLDIFPLIPRGAEVHIAANADHVTTPHHDLPSAGVADFIPTNLPPVNETAGRRVFHWLG
ncbi:L,D-transpeptidase [Paenibacillus xerothermodurans]|uniref:Murein L,D-transpeptidase n=1 Tax=Paenibacillus xerothermodurans TaxID=1977292 RepID=A0A2W1N7V1_PAEXE|nr:L,D-transpeptidase [Paenibacillus xerothermodurans]PZE20457.1 murein L,D-transpeptidase [Paenibacillus xerothermodurans]